MWRLAGNFFAVEIVMEHPLSYRIHDKNLPQSNFKTPLQKGVFFLPKCRDPSETLS